MGKMTMPAQGRKYRAEKFKPKLAELDIKPTTKGENA